MTDNAVLFSFPQIWGNLTTTCWCALTRKMKLRLLETLDSSKNYVEVVLRTELSESGMVIQACNSSTQEAIGQDDFKIKACLDYIRRPFSS